MKISHFLMVLPVVANGALAGALPNSWTHNLERRVGKNDVARCSTKCGSPTLENCNKLIEIYTTAPNADGLCVNPPDNAQGLKDVHIDCVFSFFASQSVGNSGPSCISTDDLKSVASNLAKACPGEQHAGGCFTFSDGRSLCLLTNDADTVRQCKPETLL